MTTADVLIIVPARGGSQRLPGKNLMALAGKSLPERTAGSLVEAGLADRPCLLSTDDPAIAAEGRRLGWLVPWLRPAELATAEASTKDVVLHALDWWRDRHGRDPVIFALLQVTTPFRRGADIADALGRLLADPTLPGVVAVKPVERHEGTMFRSDDRGGLHPLGVPGGPGPVLTPSGSFYMLRTAVFRRESSFFPAGFAGTVMGAIHSIDIDTAEDWQIAEAVALAVEQTGAPSRSASL